MKFYLIIIILIVAILATMALTGYIFYRIAKHYFDNQQKMQMLQMRVDEHREAVKLVTPIRLQGGETIGTEQGTLQQEQIARMDYLVENVIGQTPRYTELNPVAQATVDTAGVAPATENAAERTEK